MADADIAESADGAMLAFRCLAPSAVVQASASGDIDMLRPVAAQLLRPMLREGRLGDLFALLAHRSINLRQQPCDTAAAPGRACDGPRIRLPNGSG